MVTATQAAEGRSCLCPSTHVHRHLFLQLIHVGPNSSKCWRVRENTITVCIATPKKNVYTSKCTRRTAAVIKENARFSQTIQQSTYCSSLNDTTTPLIFTPKSASICELKSSEQRDVRHQPHDPAHSLALA